MTWTMDDARDALAEEVCTMCREYKGMLTCRSDDCGERFCVFCDYDNHADCLIQ